MPIPQRRQLKVPHKQYSLDREVVFASSDLFLVPCALVRDLSQAGGVWVSQVLSRLWPSITQAIEKQVTDTFPDLIEQNKPKWLQDVTVRGESTVEPSYPYKSQLHSQRTSTSRDHNTLL